MKMTNEMACGHGMVAGPCPRLARNTLTLGTLAIAASLSVLLLATQSSLAFQLVVLAATALTGLFVVRTRPSVRIGEEAALPAFAITESAPTERRKEPLRQRRLALVGNEVLARTRRQRQPLSVAVFDFSDLPELQAVVAGEVRRDLGPMIARKLKGIARSKAVVVRTGSTTFTVLMPTFDAARTRAAIAAQFGKACCIEFAVGGDEMLLVPDFLVQTVRPETSSVEDVYRMLRNDLVKGQLHEERRQAYLKSERESYSRHGSCSSSVDGSLIQKRPQARVPFMAPTMPAPLGLR